MIGRRSVAVVVMTGLLAACTAELSELMAPAGEQTSHLRPAAGKALVVFLRPEQRDGETQAVVYDGTQLVGVVSMSWAIVYQADPGAHRFMVVSEAADFMDAELVAGRTYYVQVRPRLGAWRARFSFRPLSATADARDIDGWVAECRLATTTERAFEWDARNRPSVLEKQAKWERVWVEKPDRPVLRAEDGKPALD